jgi:hypothetical protein
MNAACVATIAVAAMVHTAMADQFTYNVQLAGYDYDRYDEKGAIDYDGFVRVFDEFPWREQMEKWRRSGQGCSATVSISDSSHQVDYWVSVATRNDNTMFLLGIVYVKEVKGFLGFGKPRKKRWVEIYVAPSRKSILDTFKLFFTGQIDELMRTLKGLEKFDELEARPQNN